MKSRNTTPEIKLQEVLYLMGIQFKKHVSDLPGTPDIVIEESSIAVFVHGCYWHRHAGCAQPRNRDAKNPLAHLFINGAVARDASINNDLTHQGFIVYTAWECHVKANPTAVGEGLKLLHERQLLGK